jgi:hypothetical protein
MLPRMAEVHSETVDGTGETIRRAAALRSRMGSANPLKATPVDKLTQSGIEGTVSTMSCPRCEGHKSRSLDATSRLSLVNYYCCERCGLVWKRPK